MDRARRRQRLASETAEELAARTENLNKAASRLGWIAPVRHYASIQSMHNLGIGLVKEIHNRNDNTMCCTWDERPTSIFDTTSTERTMYYPTRIWFNCDIAFSAIAWI